MMAHLYANRHILGLVNRAKRAQTFYCIRILSYSVFPWMSTSRASSSPIQSSRPTTKAGSIKVLILDCYLHVYIDSLSRARLHTHYSHLSMRPGRAVVHLFRPRKPTEERRRLHNITNRSPTTFQWTLRIFIYSSSEWVVSLEHNILWSA